jgi:hypothetical protein
MPARFLGVIDADSGIAWKQLAPMVSRPRAVWLPLAVARSRQAPRHAPAQNMDGRSPCRFTLGDTGA